MYLTIVAIEDRTTRNVRKMKYYQLTLGDGSLAQLTRDNRGQMYLDGKPVEDLELRKQLNDLLVGRR